MKEKLSEIYWPLRLAYGLVRLPAGLDKYTDILADWQCYVSPMAASMFPMSVQTFMHLVGNVRPGFSSSRRFPGTLNRRNMVDAHRR